MRVHDFNTVARRCDGGGGDKDPYGGYVRFLCLRMEYLQCQHDEHLPACIRSVSDQVEKWESRQLNPFYRDEAGLRVVELERRLEDLFEELDRTDRDLRQAAVSLSFVADATTDEAQAQVAADDRIVRDARVRWEATLATHGEKNLSVVIGGEGMCTTRGRGDEHR